MPSNSPFDPSMFDRNWIAAAASQITFRVDQQIDPIVRQVTDGTVVWDFGRVQQRVQQPVWQESAVNVPLRSCCRGCHVQQCVAHRLPDLFILAGQQAGCLPSGPLEPGARRGVPSLKPTLLGSDPKPLPRHRLTYDGNYPELMHLHHEGSRHILLIPNVLQPNDALAGEVLSWLEAVHWGWLEA